MAGIRNARVFPEPVFAEPTMSRPLSSNGMDFACISVIVVKPISLIAANVCSQTLPRKDSNGWLLKNSEMSNDPSAKEKIC